MCLKRQCGLRNSTVKDIIYNNYPLITVFTPTYNRKKTLERTFESLCSQTNKDFIWLIIDDGSTDDTGDLVKGWQQNNHGFEIRYIYKTNGGMHTAHNTAYENIDTELNVCVDSDDKLSPDAIKIIYNVWNRIRNQKYAGIIGLDADFDNRIIGPKFPYTGYETTLFGFEKDFGNEDKKLVYRTDVMRQYPPYPEYKDEKLVPLSYKYLLCDQDYLLYSVNEILCNVEYQVDGSTKNIWRQRANNAKGFAFYKNIRMKYSTSTKMLIKDTIHYIASSVIGRNKAFIKCSTKKILTVCLLPFGLIYSIVIMAKANR